MASYIPKLTVSVARDSNSITLTETTGDYPTDTTGYQQTIFPFGETNLYRHAILQRLGDEPVELTLIDPTSGTNTVNITLEDGLYTLTYYQSLSLLNSDPSAPKFTIDVGLTTLTEDFGAVIGADWIDFFTSLYGVVLGDGVDIDLNDLVPISSVNDDTLNTVTLESAWTGATDSSNYVGVFKLTKKFMVANEGEGALINDIGDMALQSLHCGDGCNTEKTMKLFNRVLLKLAAQIAFAYGNYTKAHNALIMLSETSTGNNPNCSECV